MPIIQNKPIPECEVCTTRVATKRAILADRSHASVCGGCFVLNGVTDLGTIYLELELRP